MLKTHTTSQNLRHFPVEAQRMADAAIQEREERLRTISNARNRKAAEVAAGASDRLRRLLGDDNWADLTTLMHQERLALRDLLQPPHGLESTFADLNEARKQKADAFLRARKVRRDELAEIREDYHEAMADVLAPVDAHVTPGFHLSSHLDRWLRLSPFHAHALPWGVIIADGDPGPHRWEVHRPPFFGFNFGFVPVRNDNFIVDRMHTLNPSLGDVGITVTMDDGDAGDFDYASGDGFSAIAFSFTPPTAGLVEVLIDAQSVEATHRLRTENEWGWSNSTTGQGNFLMLDVLHPSVAEPSYAQMSAFHLQTDDDSSHVRENLTRGAHYFAHLFSAGPVPANEPVIVCAGTRSFDLSGTNDVSIHSRSDFRWFISSVEVRISP
ncbi:hypothetical protein [Micromonospora sp. NPDC005173]|uniref:hypothetical protein n=1 Tax=Micromonospora sp. NPDC005173 TaxID=3157165 RepID=UPI0033B59AC2